MPWTWRYTSPMCLQWSHDSHGAPVRNSGESASSTRIESSMLRTDRWCIRSSCQTPHSTKHWHAQGSKHWSTYHGWHVQLISRPWGSSGPSTGPFLAHELKVDEDNVEQFLGSDVVFAQLANIEDCIIMRHRAEQHLINMHHLAVLED